MADRASGDRPERRTNGKVEAQPTRDAPALASSLRDQSRADADQTGSDTDQTLADADQTGSDSDQTSADIDQLAADRDQAASDHDLEESGAGARVHDQSRDMRRRTALRREETAAARMVAAEQRDAVADTRDVAGHARDQAADARDHEMAQRDLAVAQREGVRAVSGAEIVMRAAGQRKHAAQQRVRAAEQRALAAKDRRDAASDREEAAAERRRSLVDRELFARQLALAEVDPLTGARTRAAGLSELDREVERCHRTGALLVVVYIDIVGLKALNDSDGHSAGDALLKRVVASMRAHVRPYDTLARLGGDEFLCSMPNVTPQHARERFNAVAAELAAADGAAIAIGVAELAPGESAEALVAHADAALISGRRAV